MLNAGLKDEMRALALSLAELAQCPVCFGSLYPSHSLCMNGHGICSTCRESITRCPLCQQQFPTMLKSTLLNQLLERLPVVCPFSDKGCPVVMLDREHQDFCEFRMSSCRMPDCKWTGCIKYLQNHAKALHDIPCYEIPRGPNHTKSHSILGNCRLDNITVNHCNWYLVKFDSQLFWKSLRRDGNLQQISYQFFHLSTNKPKYVYYFIVSFKKDNFEFTTTCKAVNSVDEERGVVEENVMTIPDCVLHKFSKTKNPIECRYTIEVVKEKL